MFISLLSFVSSVGTFIDILLDFFSFLLFSTWYANRIKLETTDLDYCKRDQLLGKNKEKLRIGFSLKCLEKY